MINNQIISAVIKNNEITAQVGGDIKNHESTSDGQLFKFIMSSLQGAKDGSEASGEWGEQQHIENILGAKLLSTIEENEVGEGDRVMDIMASLDESTKNELLTISELLNNPETQRSGKDADTYVLPVENRSEKLTDTETDTDTENASTSEFEEKAVDSLYPLFHSNAGIGNELTADENGGLDEDISNTETEDSGEAAETLLNNTNEIYQGEKNTTPTTAILETEGISENAAEKGAEEESNLKDTPQPELHEKEVNDLNSLFNNKRTVPLASDSAAEVKAETVVKNPQSLVQEINSTMGENFKGAQNPLFTYSGQMELTDEGNEIQTDGSTTYGKKTRGSGQPLHERGIVNQLRAFAAAQSIAAQTSEIIPPAETSKIKTTDPELLQNIFKALSNGNINQEVAEVRSLKANQIRELRSKNYQTTFANRLDYSFAEGSSTTGSGSVAPVTGADKLNVISANGIVPASAAYSLDQMNEDGAILWKEHIAEYFESNEKSASENQAAFSRLGQVPVTNIAVRRNFSMSLGQAIMNATGDGKKAAETWQKHRFVLENDKNIQLSARQIDGVLQLKLSSSHSELSKLLMNHQDEIREHLEKEIDVKIDLHLEGQGAEQSTEFFSGSGTRKQTGKQFHDSGAAKTKEQSVEEVVPKAVRKFGYNQMEWTA